MLFVYDDDAVAGLSQPHFARPVFVGAAAPNAGGLYVVNRAGQVLLVTLNKKTAVVPFISRQLKNLELALSLASRG